MGSLLARTVRAFRNRIGREISGRRKRDALFVDVAHDPARFAEDMKKPEWPVLFAIFFTPRSGSSWLTDTLLQARGLGFPQEWFNPNFVAKNASALNASTMEEYIALLRRRHPGLGGFSFEITAGHIDRSFGGARSYLGHFPGGLPSFYLRREDMALQAVSLAKAVQSNVFHSPYSSDEDRDRADTTVEYDGAAIAKWFLHILHQEQALEEMFVQHGISPLRLSYEGITAAGAEDVVARFRAHLGQSAHKSARISPKHEKIGTDRNRAFADQFRRDYPALIAEVAEFRAALPSHDWSG